MKFLIKRRENVPEFDGTGIKWGTGETPFVDHEERMNDRKFGSKIKFHTGLKAIHIETNRQLTKEEREVYKEKLETAIPLLQEHFPELKDENNDVDEVFWNNERTTLKINNSTFSSVFDTDQDPENALLYYGILGGAFGGIAPSLEIAERGMGIKYYLTAEDDFAEKKYEEEFGIKRKAIGALDRLLEEKGIDPLLYITYATIPQGKGFTRNTSKAVFEKLLMEFIEGKFNKTGKKLAAQTFYDNYKLWKADKETFVAKAILSAAHHYQYIYFKDGKFITSINNTVLGSRIEDSYKMLMKPENQTEFDEIRKLVNEELNK